MAMSDSSTDWLAIANRMRDFMPLQRLEQSVVSFLEQRRDEPWVVACSGGADSICLALAAWGCFGEREGHLHLAHFNHRLRGEESDADQGFVENLASSLDLEIAVGHAKEIAENPSEADLRDERQTFLSEFCSKVGAQVLLLGHHRDDLAETMLMRLTRGSGAEGLAAPRPLHLVQGLWRIRPLLALTRSELRENLRGAGAVWREDSSNDELGPFRNRVRAQVLPKLAEASPSEALAGFARSRSLLEEDVKALNDWTAEAFSQIALGEGSLDARALRDLPMAVMRRVLRKWLGDAGVADSLSARAFDELLAGVSAGHATKSSLSENLWVQLDADKVSLVEGRQAAKGWGPCSLPTGGVLFLPDFGVLQLDEALDGDKARQALHEGGMDESREVLLDADSLSGSLSARTWLPGDRYAPLGAPGSRKLQDMFTDRKVPVKRREQVPVILSGDLQIAWCPGFPPAERCRVTSCSRAALHLTYADPKSL